MVHHGRYGSQIIFWVNRSCKQNEKYGYMFYALLNSEPSKAALFFLKCHAGEMIKKYIFFSGSRSGSLDIYWVATKVIKEKSRPEIIWTKFK